MFDGHRQTQNGEPFVFILISSHVAMLANHSTSKSSATLVLVITPNYHLITWCRMMCHHAVIGVRFHAVVLPWHDFRVRIRGVLGPFNVGLRCFVAVFSFS